MGGFEKISGHEFSSYVRVDCFWGRGNFLTEYSTIKKKWVAKIDFSAYFPLLEIFLVSGGRMFALKIVDSKENLTFWSENQIKHQQTLALAPSFPKTEEKTVLLTHTNDSFCGFTPPLWYKSA